MSRYATTQMYYNARSRCKLWGRCLGPEAWGFSVSSFGGWGFLIEGLPWGSGFGCGSGFSAEGLGLRGLLMVSYQESAQQSHVQLHRLVVVSENDMILQ